MKYFIIITLSFFMLHSFSSIAQQLKVRSDGTTVINGDRPADDANGEVACIVYGDNGTALSGGRLAIGDYGRMAYHGANVFLGEYGTTDSDILQLHGKKGMYFTRDDGDIIAYYKFSEGNKFK